MKTNLKDNIWILGFDKETDYRVAGWSMGLSLLDKRRIIYEGWTEYVPEKIAKECVEYFIERCKYKNYNPEKLVEGIRLNGFNYPQQSIQSACDKKYCIIYKGDKYEFSKFKKSS